MVVPSLGCRRVAVAGSALDIEDVRLRQRVRYPPVLRVLCYLGGCGFQYNLVVVFVVVPSAADVSPPCSVESRVRVLLAPPPVYAVCKGPGATKEGGSVFILSYVADTRGRKHARRPGTVSLGKNSPAHDRVRRGWTSKTLTTAPTCYKNMRCGASKWQACGRAAELRPIPNRHRTSDEPDRALAAHSDLTLTTTLCAQVWAIYCPINRIDVRFTQLLQFDVRSAAGGEIDVRSVHISENDIRSVRASDFDVRSERASVILTSGQCIVAKLTSGRL
jgi:hypothetical protein